MRRSGQRYYLYRHIRLDNNETFYIGIGHGRRFRYKIGRNNLWCKIYEKCGRNILCEILLYNLSPEEANTKEKEFIKLYGRKDLGTGSLANLTDGGDGCLNMSPEGREKISKANTGKKRTEEEKKRMGDKRRGRKHTSEAKRKIGDAQLGEKNHRFGYKFNEEEREVRCRQTENSNNGNYKGRIIMLDKKTFEEIIIFQYPSQIRKFFGLKKDNNLADIYAVISGRKKSYRGFKWKRAA